MPNVAISDLIIDTGIQIRRGNREETIRRYEDAFDRLPPIDVSGGSAHLAPAQALAEMEPKDLFDLAHGRSGSRH